MICIFANDSYFSYLLAKEIFAYYHPRIECVVFSRRFTGTFAGIIKVYRKTNIRYFSYRTFVQVLTIINNIVGKKSINALCKKYDVQSFSTNNICKDIDRIQGDRKWRLGIAFNFDQILGEEIIGKFELGIINIHASKLPAYRGISPALWAFAKGDNTIWVSIYLMDKEIDSGSILRQFSVGVEPKDSAFSLYERVCDVSGKVLAETLREYLDGLLRPQGMGLEEEESYFSWPNKEHLQLMKKNGRRYITMRDILRALR